MKKRIAAGSILAGLLLISMGLLFWTINSGRSTYKADTVSSSGTFIRLNNYNNWRPPTNADELSYLTKRDQIVMSEWYATTSTPKLTPADIKVINPNAKVYQYYALSNKTSSETDWPAALGTVTSATSTTLTDTLKSWAVKQFWGRHYVRIVSGTGSGQIKRISTVYASNSTTGIIDSIQLYSGQTFSPIPDSSSKYQVITSADASTLVYAQTDPIPYDTIVQNDWWLRDGSGATDDSSIVKESSRSWLLDVGKSGFAQEYLTRILERLNGKGYDGIVFDIWWPTMISTWVTGQGLTPPANYQTDSEWREKAWKPFISYVMAGLRSAGYTVIGNCAGQYIDKYHPDPNATYPDNYYKWQREQLDGTVYEQGAVDWRGTSGSGWLDGDTIYYRIESVARDPIITWADDGGLIKCIDTTRTCDVSGQIALLDQKRIVSLAYYYIAVPTDQSRHSYGHAYDWYPFWHNMFDFDIGSPAADRVKVTGKYAWSRKYTGGLVLLNYGATAASTETQVFTLETGKEYTDVSGNKYYNSVTLPAHTALILKSTTLPALSISAGGNQTSYPNRNITQVSSQITGPPIASYSWSKVSGPGTVTFGSSTAATTTIKADTAGSYTIRLTATDISGGTATSDMVLTVNKNGDINGDQAVNANDFTLLLFNWGVPKNSLADFNADGTVNESDFTILIYWWGK